MATGGGWVGRVGGVLRPARVVCPSCATVRVDSNVLCGVLLFRSFVVVVCVCFDSL